MAETHRKKGLRREIGLGLLVFYGLGNILGAGIYVLVVRSSKSAATIHLSLLL